LPAEGQNLIRASIIDNTERERAQRALRWAVIAATAMCLWTVLVIAWAATG